MDLAPQGSPADSSKFKLGSNSPITTQNGGGNSRRSQLHHMLHPDMDTDTDTTSKSSKFLEPGEIMRPSPSMGKLTRSRGQQQQAVDSGENSDASSTSSASYKVQPPPPPPPPQSGKQRSRKSFTTAPKESPAAATPTPAPNFNQVDLAALAALFLAPGNDPDERLTVINIEDGTRLQGNKAPKRGELAMWLLAHPNYLPDEQEILNMTMQTNMANMAALLQQQQQEPVSRNNSAPTQKGGETSDDESSAPASKTTTPTMTRTSSSNRPGLRPHHEPSPQQQSPSTFDSNSLPILFNKVCLIKLISVFYPLLNFYSLF